MEYEGMERECVWIEKLSSEDLRVLKKWKKMKR